MTGTISESMRAATLSSCEAVPGPKVFIASGACAISGGPFYGKDAFVGDLHRLIPVDLHIPGCPLSFV